MKIISTLLSILGAFIISGNASAQKSVYLPNQWKENKEYGVDTLLYKETDVDNKYTWSLSRSKQSDNFICLWDNKYAKEPSLLAKTDAYYVNIDDLLQKAEAFYSMNTKTLGFCDESKSNISKYKMMILVNHSTEWICYGSGYDDVIGALWLSPRTCRPVGHSVAHEVGHSFQYMCWVDNGGNSGFRAAIGKGATYWEQCAQWQANQSYPEEIFKQSWGLFSKTHNYAMTHEWHRYQSYWWNYYLAEKYGIDFIGKLWCYNPSKESDPNQVFMEMMGYDANAFYKEFFDYAMKMATLDFDVCRDQAEFYMDSYAYNYVPLGNNKFQVAYSSCPQGTGFNIIPLKVPQAGTNISTEFVSIPLLSALQNEDPSMYFDGEKYVKYSGTTYNDTGYRYRGFRIGYVALLEDGTRKYISEDMVYATGKKVSDPYKATLNCTVPENVKRLFLVIVPAPSKYTPHLWDDDISNDDQWPYTVEFTNTTMLDYAEIGKGQSVCDAVLEYDVYLPIAATTYDYVSVPLSGVALAAIGSSLQLQSSAIGAKMEEWKSTSPTEGKIAFFAVNADGEIANSKSTANGYGHWFTADGNITNWGNASYVYSEFNPSTLTFNVGQYPGLLVKGKDYKLTQAFRYKTNGQIATVKFVFNIHATTEKSGAVLARTSLSPLQTTGMSSCCMGDKMVDCRVYDIMGNEMMGSCKSNGKSQKVLVDGKVRIVK